MKDMNSKLSDLTGILTGTTPTNDAHSANPVSQTDETPNTSHGAMEGIEK